MVKKPDASCRRVTIDDVAKHAGVGRGTVSRVINDQTGVSADKRESVLKAIKELDYRPNASARRLRGVAAGTICFLVSRNPLDHWFHSRVLDSVASECSRRGMTLLYSSWQPSDETSEHVSLPNAVSQNDALDGVIVGGTCYEPLLEMLDDSGIAYVTHGNEAIYQGVPSLFDAVYVNEVAGAYDMTELLIDKGHRRIEFAGSLSCPEGHLRYEGFAKAMRRSKLEHRYPVQVAEYDAIGKGRIIADMFIKSGELPDAFFAAGGDGIAFGIIRRLQEEGIKVPDDVSVAGFGGLDYYPFDIDDMATVRFPAEELGRESVDLLIEKVSSGGTRCAVRTLPMEIYPGRTIATSS